MKKSLLATVAAVALIAVPGLASAEGAKDQADSKGGATITTEPMMKKGPAIKADAEQKGKEQKGKAETTGQAADQKNAPAAKSSAEDKSAPARPSTQAAPGTSTPSSAPGARVQGTQAPSPTVVQGQAGASTSPQAGAPVNLTAEQKTKIRASVLQSSSAPKVSKSQINFTLRIGTAVPRTVRFADVPPTLVEIHPLWRGYRYFVVDDEIVIVDPRTLQIVAIIEV